MATWKYEVWACRIEGSEAQDHDGTCGMWERTSIFWDVGWFAAMQMAAGYDHAFVQSVYTVTGGTVTMYEHVRGGGLCRGCWMRHTNIHTEHVISKESGLCSPCVNAQKRRGPLTRTPDGEEFMCDDCRREFRRSHEESAYQAGRDADQRLYRPVLDVAREDARAS